jgi:hypothetical protein
MSQQGTTYIRKPGTTPDDAFLQHLLDNCPKVWGAVVLDKGVLDTFYGENLDLESLKNTCEEFKDCTVVFYFADSDGGVNIDKDVPPFTVIVNDDEESLVCIIPEGNFPGFEKAGSSHPSIYHLGEHLTDEFYTVFDMVDKDLDKFMAAIEKEGFKKKVAMNAVGRGYVTVVAQNGRVLTYLQGDPPVEFDHGFVTNAFGFGKQEEKAPEPEKKKGMFSKSTTREKHTPAPSASAAAAEAAANPPKTETAVKAPEPSGVPKIPPKAVKKPLVIEDIKVTKVKIPPMNRKGRANWIKERIGYKPQTLDDPNATYEVYSRPDGVVLTRDEINRLFGLSAANLNKDKPLTNAPPLGANTENQNIDSSKEIIQPLPILSGAARERAKRIISDERLQKVIAENASIITDPENIQGNEAKVALFYQQTGEKDMSQWDALPFVELEKIGRQDIHMMACMAHTWRLRALRAELKLGKAKPVQEKMEKQLQEAADAVAEPEKAEEQPKRGMFSKRRVA